MRNFFHYLFSLAAHLVSFGLGRRSSLSSIPLTRGKSIPIKPIPGWQMFIAIWILQKLWSKYGGRVTAAAKRQVSKYQGPGSDTVRHFAGSNADKKTFPAEVVAETTSECPDYS